ncbi:MAG: DUF2723 domain-containing protein [Vicingaceae bacterium]
MEQVYKKLNNIVGWIVFIIASVVYLSTIEPTASFWDCGEYILTAYKLEVGHPPGAPFFLLMGRLFSMFASPEKAAMMINVMSALCSSFTILFLFWTITAFAKKLALNDGKELTKNAIYAILGSGAVGALAYTFSDSFWFSAVEGEVYAMSSLFTAVVFWAILKWENVADQPGNAKWLVFISFLMGLSVGVHLLNLLAIPAIVFIYYLKKNPKPNYKQIAIVGIVSILILGTVQSLIIPGIVQLGGWFERVIVNSFGVPFNTGTLIFILLLAGGIYYAIRYTHKKGKAVLNVIVLCFTAILIGYSTFAVIVIRSNANPPLDENNPETMATLLSYLNREQYGDWPVLYGQYFNSPLDPREPYKDGKPTWYQDKESGKYIIIDDGKNSIPNYDPKTTGFTRMWSPQKQHIRAYKQWSDFKGKKVRASNGEMITIPTFGDNLRYMLRYQMGHMYWRYFMWNFAGRQNDVQGHGGILNGNWMSGVPFLDKMFSNVKNPEKLPKSITSNKAHNKFYMLPFILGLIGLFYQIWKRGMDALVIGLLFLFTGLAIIVYINQYPFQPRERDYAYVGSFYAFAIWIGLGVYAIYDLIRTKIPESVAAIGVSLVCLTIPTIMGAQGWDDHDRSGRYTARDFAKNYLDSCAPNAILFTNGDNDTFPLWYVQEVEGYRTDVRVVNLSLLNTDWYINQMRRKAYDSDPIPHTMPEYKYRQGTNDYIPIYDRKLPGFIDVKEIMKVVNSDSPQAKVTTADGKSRDFIPTTNFKVKVNKQQVIKDGVVPKGYEDRVLDEITWSVKKSYLLKNELVILDILAANDWKRPIYFAITTGSDSYLGLTDYFQLEGLAYRLVPYKAKSYDGQTGEVNAEIMYNNLMNKFQWGGMDVNDIYMDENNLRMTMNFRNNFSRLADELIRIGDKERAEKVLDKSIEVLPDRNVPLNFFALPVAEAYYKIGKKEKAEKLIIQLADIYEDDLKYFLSLKREDRMSIQEDIERTMAVLQRIIYIVNEQYPDGKLSKDFNQRFDEINKLIVNARS